MQIFLGQRSLYFRGQVWELAPYLQQLLQSPAAALPLADFLRQQLN